MPPSTASSQHPLQPLPALQPSPSERQSPTQRSLKDCEIPSFQLVLRSLPTWLEECGTAAHRDMPRLHSLCQPFLHPSADPSAPTGRSLHDPTSTARQFIRLQSPRELE